MLAVVIKFVIKHKSKSIGVGQDVPVDPYFYAGGKPCVSAFLFALESEAIGENAQFHKDPRCARIVVESRTDDSHVCHGVGRRGEIERFLEQVRYLFKLRASDLIFEVKVGGNNRYLNKHMHRLVHPEPTVVQGLGPRLRYAWECYLFVCCCRCLRGV